MDAQCSTCGEAASPVNAVWVALVVIIAALVIFYLVVFLSGKTHREKYVSRRAREVYDSAKVVFEEGGGDVRYSEYKNKVPGADPVQYSDIRRLFKGGGLSPSNVEKVISQS